MKTVREKRNYEKPRCQTYYLDLQCRVRTQGDDTSIGEYGGSYNPFLVGSDPYSN